MVKITVIAHTDKLIDKKVVYNIEEAKKLVEKWKKKYGTGVSMDVDVD